MTTMICANCHSYGICWRDLTGMMPYTYCPHCGGTNCQEPEPAVDDDEAQEDSQ